MQPGVGVCEMAVFQVVFDCILLSCSLINWLWIKQFLQQQTVSSSSQRVIKEKILTSLPCLSHLHPLDCLSSFFCWRNARISMNCHFFSSICRLISQSLYFNLITKWWYPGQINVSAVLYATVLDFRKYPLWVMLFLSIMLALGSLARDQGSQAPHGAPAQYKNSHFLGIFLCGSYSLQTCRLDEPGVFSSWKAFSLPPMFPPKPSSVQKPASLMPLTSLLFLLGSSSSSSVDSDTKPNEMVITLLNYTSNSKCT